MTARDTWSASEYLRFERERTRPVHDLLSGLLQLRGAAHDGAVAEAVDLGCGPGNSTEVLAGYFPRARILGLDSSADMIEAARRRLPRAEFRVGDLRDWADDATNTPVDLILSNAVLQWVPAHERLLPALLARLAPKGTLALQLPDNLEEPAQLLMREVAAEGPWADRLTMAEAARVPIQPPGWYYARLAACRARVEVWRTTYFHALRGVEAVVDWFRSTGLRPYLDPLDATERERFLARYRERLSQRLAVLADGTVLLPFPRLFIVAQRI